MVNVTDLAPRQIGVNFNKLQEAEVWLWAPQANMVNLKMVDSGFDIPLESLNYGYWYIKTNLLKPGEQYQFELHNDEGTKMLPDPASLSQANGVHQASQAFDLYAYPWTDKNWKGIEPEDYIIYELHTGTFSPEGNFHGIEQQLDYLVELGITAIEIMPVAEFPGNRNWGYDGVFPFAVQSSYGGPLGLQNLVNACHQKGLAVILDVVYNHFGPEGNYFKSFGPYFTDKYHTPWGEALNFDDANCDGVRHFFIENVLMWFRDFHIDALRLDAVHAIKDFSAQHILAEIKTQVDKFCSYTHKKHQLIIECDLNDNKYINPLQQNGYGMDAQWNDEFHHALRVAAGQPKQGYYADFNGIPHLAKAYKDAYVYDGIFSEERQKTFGTKADGNPGRQFVVFSQNHDQVGNRPLGERTSILHSFEMQKVMAAAVLVSPFVPLLFMGEEYGETNPFLYFVSHTDPELVAAVRKGRKEEFKAFHLQQEVPDPQDEQTFKNSKLQWQLLIASKHQALFTYYKDLIALRKNHEVLKQLDRNTIETYEIGDNCLLINRWQAEKELICLLNFSSEVQEIKIPTNQQSWEIIFDSNAYKYGGSAPTEKFLPADAYIRIQPETFLIYTNSYA